MKLAKARIQKYRSIRDTGWFDIEQKKSIFVGANEAGKTAVLRALQQINPPNGVPGFDMLRDYPRALYQDIKIGNVKPAETTIVEAVFELSPEDLKDVPAEFKDCKYSFSRRLDNSARHNLEGGPSVPMLREVKSDLLRLAAHVDSNMEKTETEAEKPSQKLAKVLEKYTEFYLISGDLSKSLKVWMESVLPLVTEGSKEEERYNKVLNTIGISEKRDLTLDILHKRLPVFVLFSNYYRVFPLIHLEHLAHRIESKVLDDEQYDYGNQCLLKLLGFTARELSDLGKAKEPQINNSEALKKYRDQLDTRKYQLNAASTRLTTELRTIWNPDEKKDEAHTLRIDVDGQYLKVVVVDDLGVEVELDQRSEGFQWLVSFFVVFFAEAIDQHSNAVLLLDEPGLSLHGLKQREFRSTLSRLSENNQTIYTTHSPFLVGPGELDLVRVVEMTSRSSGTKVHTSVSAENPASLLPLQEALGYDLAQSLFAQQNNLVLEGLTDYWYLDATSQLLLADGHAGISEKIALVPANSAGKVVYFATILHSQKLKVAALLDSDAAGDQAAEQDTLVHVLGNKRILRTKDSYSGQVAAPEIEDLLRETLVKLAKDKLNWDVEAVSKAQPARAIVDIFKAEISDFSKYKLAKAYVRWSRDHEAKDMTDEERKGWAALIEKINKAFK